MLRFRDTYDSMHMIGHDHERPQTYMRKVIGYGQPASVSDFTDWGKLHFTIHNLAEVGNAVFCDDRHKIRSLPPIVPKRGTRGFDPVFVFVFCHSSFQMSIQYANFVSMIGRTLNIG